MMDFFVRLVRRLLGLESGNNDWSPADMNKAAPLAPTEPIVCFTPESVRPSIDRWLETTAAQEIRRAFILMNIEGEEFGAFIALYKRQLMAAVSHVESENWWETVVTAYSADSLALVCIAEAIVKRRMTLAYFVPYFVANDPPDFGITLHRIDNERKLDANSGLPQHATNSSSWTEDEITAQLEHVKAQLDWANTNGSARKWWEAFENENQHRRPLVLRLADELAVRKATITEFFLAFVYSNTDNIQGNLCYLDYTRIKKWEKKKRDAANRAHEHSRGGILVESPPRPVAGSSYVQFPPGITDVGSWTEQQIQKKLDEVRATLGLANGTQSAREWWEKFEKQVKTNFVLHLAEKLAARKATITELFLAYVDSRTDNIDAVLCYVDYTRLKQDSERKTHEADRIRWVEDIRKQPEKFELIVRIKFDANESLAVRIGASAPSHDDDENKGFVRVSVDQATNLIAQLDGVSFFQNAVPLDSNSDVILTGSLNGGTAWKSGLPCVPETLETLTQVMTELGDAVKPFLDAIAKTVQHRIGVLGLPTETIHDHFRK